MDAQDIRRIQEDIARVVAGNVTDVMDGEWEDREWVHLFVDIEIDEDGERSSSISFALTRLPGQPLEKCAFRLASEAKQLFDELAEAMRRPGEDRWSSAQLRIERNGSFAFEFSHDPPWRLGGNLLDKRFEDYLERWHATPEGTRFTQEAKSPGVSFWGKLTSLLNPGS